MSDLKSHAEKSVGTGSLKAPEPFNNYNHPTGDQYIDRGTVDKGTGILDDDQRARLLQALGERIMNARSEYATALTDMRVDALVEKEEDLGWVAELLLGIIVSQAAIAIKVIVKHLQTSPTALHELTGALHLHEQNEDLHESFKNISSEGITEVVKDSVVKVAGTSAVAEEKSEKSTKVSYIEKLRDAAGITFLQILQNGRATLPDTGLISLYATYDPAKHTASMYKAKLVEQVERYMKSFVRRIGLTVLRGYPSEPDPLQEGRGANTQTKIVFLLHPQKQTMDVAYQVADEETIVEKGGAVKRRVASPYNYHLVEPELKHLAIERHVAKWGQPPEVIVIDDNLQPEFKKKKSDKPTDYPAGQIGVGEPWGVSRLPDRPTNVEERGE